MTKLSGKKSIGAVSQAPGAVALNFREKMFAGAIARGVAQTLLHPVDVLRTRIQARNVTASFKPSVFVKGVIPQITLAIPAGAMQFVAFEAANEKLAELMPDERFAQVRTLFAGAFGALSAAVFRVPQEVLKQRIQADIYPNLLVALRETIWKQGLPSVYKGALATISRDVPWNALSFMFHAQGKTMFKSIKGREPASDENLIIAGVAGAFAAVIMTPVDVVKTRIMTAPPGQVSAGIIGTLRNIVTEEGAATLMKGVLPRIVFLAPLAGITFSVYESVAAKLKKRKAATANVQAGGVKAPLRGSREGLQEGKRQLYTFAMRFSKTPVRLAHRGGRSDFGSYVGDYQVASARIAFTLRV